MDSDSINLTPLLEYIKTFPIIPYKNHDPEIFEPFKEIYLELLSNVPDVPGWYVWLNKNAKPDETTIYIGQSQSRKTSSIKARLTEELLDEHVSLWATVHNPDSIFRTLDAKSDGKYTTYIKRSLRKAGTTDIIWVGENQVTDDQLNYVEHMLIKLHHPPANKRKPKFSLEYPRLLEEVLLVTKRECDKIINAKTNK